MMEWLKVINVHEISKSCDVYCDFADCIPALKALLGPQFHAEQADDGTWRANLQTAQAWAISFPEECGVLEAVNAA
ncbi:MAG: hypothetical protein EKK71_16350 [Candidatus Competibacteraceae bacterium]|nr:MAG: hypothetical protein EKK71_16350 [Candidatus Competibacteraceae bacterium]